MELIHIMINPHFHQLERFKAKYESVIRNKEKKASLIKDAIIPDLTIIIKIPQITKTKITKKVINQLIKVINSLCLASLRSPLSKDFSILSNCIAQ
jgi:hypothetical protein